jgi:hypothetical protein
MEYKEFLKASERLLFSPEFKEIDARLEFHEPNIWQILKIPQKEIYVSRFLAWLLDPSKHNFGAQFLKSLVIEALKTEKGRQTAELPPVEFAVMDLSDAIVEIEVPLNRKCRCDIVVKSSKGGFLCVIENKVWSSEGREQTNHYYELSFSEYRVTNYPKRVYIYLSPYGVPPRNEHFIALSYQTVLDILKELQDDRRVIETERFLLRQFQESLRIDIVMDRETLDLAQAVYETHGPIIDHIRVAYTAVPLVRRIYETCGRTIDFVYKNAEKPDTTAAWDGKSWFFNIGEVGPDSYSWNDSQKYSFICAGGGKRYRQIMQNLKRDDIVYAYVSGSGYVGVGTVTKEAMPFREATLEDGKKKLVDLRQAGQLAGTYSDSSDDDKSDWIVLVKWEKAVEKSQAVRLVPIVPSTASRIYDHRKDFVEKIRHGLGPKN